MRGRQYGVGHSILCAMPFQPTLTQVPGISKLCASRADISAFLKTMPMLGQSEGFIAFDLLLCGSVCSAFEEDRGQRLQLSCSKPMDVVKQETIVRYDLRIEKTSPS